MHIAPKNDPYFLPGITDCRFRLNGTRLSELRRVRLRAIAQGLGIPLDGAETKVELLCRLVAKLEALGLPDELSRSLPSSARSAARIEVPTKKKPVAPRQKDKHEVFADSRLAAMEKDYERVKLENEHLRAVLERRLKQLEASPPEAPDS